MLFSYYLYSCYARVVLLFIIINIGTHADRRNSTDRILCAQTAYERKIRII